MYYYKNHGHVYMILIHFILKLVIHTIDTIIIITLPDCFSVILSSSSLFDICISFDFTRFDANRMN